jgi:antirestriction protein ArdC
MRTSTAASRADLYSRVTERVIADLEKGVRPWLKPWSTGNASSRPGLPRRHNGVPYRGINILVLWGEALDKSYSSTIWMTFKQALALGGHVRRGEHGAVIVYADRIIRTETDERDEDVEREIPFLKAYSVFNVVQIDGLPAHYYADADQKADKPELIENAERFFSATDAIIRHGGDQAYYSPGPDVIQLPVPQAFRDAESYAATMAHELAHWTSHPQRLARDFGGKRFGDAGYAREELVAELGAAFLCADLGIALEPREDHASYLGHWLGILREDKRAIFAAAAHAQRAVDYLHGLQPERAVTTERALIVSLGALKPWHITQPVVAHQRRRRPATAAGPKRRARRILPRLSRVCR